MKKALIILSICVIGCVESPPKEPPIDWEAEAETCRKELEESEKEVERLKRKVSDLNYRIEELEETISANEQYIEELEWALNYEY